MSIVYDSILNHISQHSILSEEEKERFCAALTYKKIRRRQYLLQEGTICTRECFVIKGALRQYEVSPTGRENTVQFAFENWWISDWYSTLQAQPSVYNIDALEDTEVFLILNNRFCQQIIAGQPLFCG